jgi:ABC-type phosphonate transport system ATPase subunit
MTAPAIQLTGLSKNFGAVHAVVDVDLQVDRGEVDGRVGAMLQGGPCYPTSLSHRPSPSLRAPIAPRLRSRRRSSRRASAISPDDG